MTQHDDTVRLRHMLDHAQEAVEAIRGRQRDDLKRNRILQLALVRLVEIVGEAAARVSQEGRERYPAIPWQQAVGMRNQLIHGYDAIDLDVLWDTIQDDLPALMVRLCEALGEGA